MHLCLLFHICVCVLFNYHYWFNTNNYHFTYSMVSTNIDEGHSKKLMSPFWLMVTQECKPIDVLLDVLIEADMTLASLQTSQQSLEVCVISSPVFTYSQNFARSLFFVKSRGENTQEEAARTEPRSLAKLWYRSFTAAVNHSFFPSLLRHLLALCAWDLKLQTFLVAKSPPV